MAAATEAAAAAVEEEEEEGTGDRFHVRFDRADMNYLRGFCDIALAPALRDAGVVRRVSSIINIS